MKHRVPGTTLQSPYPSLIRILSVIIEKNESYFYFYEWSLFLNFIIHVMHV